MVLETLACEEGAERIADRVAVNCAMMPVIQIPQLKEFIGTINRNLEKIWALRSTDLPQIDALNSRISSVSLVKLFTSLEQSGIIRFTEPTEETMNTDHYRAKLEKDLAAGVISYLGGIGAK